MNLGTKSDDGIQLKGGHWKRENFPFDCWGEHQQLLTIFHDVSFYIGLIMVLSNSH